MTAPIFCRGFGSANACALVLRGALACCFFSHGVLALLVNPGWFAFYAVFGLSVQTAQTTMPFVGALDIVVAALLLSRPVLPLLVWSIFWTVFTAALRPLSGLEAGELVVRAMNFGPAIGLVLLHRGASVVVLRAWLVVATGAVIVGALMGGSLLPGNTGSALEWLERAGAIGLPLAALLTFLKPTSEKDSQRLPSQ